MTQDERYSSVVVKISGESLAADDEPLCHDRFEQVAQALKVIHVDRIAITVVVGGGNIWRGPLGRAWGLDPVESDAAGMVATGLNAQLLQSKLHRIGVPTRILSRGPCTGIGTPYTPTELRGALSERQVVVLAGGLGLSGYSTDMPAVQAVPDAAANVVVVAKHKVDGVYTKDPRKYPDKATLIPKLTVTESLAAGLGYMDQSALTWAREHRVYIQVIGAEQPSDLVRAIVQRDPMGTAVLPE